jgi:hypothetical protein
MKQKIQKIFTVFMVLTILVSSHAFAYYEHICLITKQKTLSFDAKTCAGKFTLKEESKTPEFKRSSCCELNLKVQKVDNAQQNHLHFPDFLVYDGQLNIPTFSLGVIESFKEKTNNIAFTNTSPPRLKLFILNAQFLI